MYPAALTLLTLTAVPADTSAPPNFDFARGSLDGWKGSGFYLIPGGRPGVPASPAATSADSGSPTRKGTLRYVFKVPEGATRIRCRAHAVLAPGCKADHRLNVMLLGAGNRVLPKQIQSGLVWVTARGLRPPLKGAGHEYAWDVSTHVGQTLQIALIDQDPRPGCYVVASGFRVETVGAGAEQEFARHMQGLADKHGLPAVKRYESKHFVAWSNAAPDFTAERLRNCEALHSAFLSHFRGKGFTVKAPAGRLMVALFDAQAGFEAYLGEKTSPNLMGIYHTPSNRLVIYDVYHNRGVQAGKEQVARIGARMLDIDRQQFLRGAERHSRTFCEDANVSTTTHEAAHQISFNCGLLSRTGDVPPWLAEGLATYCEPAVNGSWQGLGAPNYERARGLAAALRGKGRLVPLAQLVGPGDWRKDSATLLTGYGQSWALFRMLMEERPQALRAYLKLIADRRTPDHRLTDFRQIFGADLSQLERRHYEYVREMAQRYGPREQR